MSSLPLQQFFASLESSQIRPTVRDYERILTVLKSNDSWSLENFRDMLRALLAKNPDEQEVFTRQFHAFFDFDREIARPLSDIDLNQIRQELEILQTRRETFTPGPPKVTRGIVGPQQPESITKSRPLVRYIVRMAVLCIVAIVLVKSQLFQPPIIEITPTSIDFGSVSLNSTVTKEVSIKNSGSRTVLVSEITLSEQTGNPFSLKREQEVNRFPLKLHSGEVQTFHIVFCPTSAPERQNKVTIMGNAKDSPHFITLSGRGLPGLPPEPPVIEDTPAIEQKTPAVTTHDKGMKVPRKRRYENVPAVTGIHYTPIHLPNTWKKFAGLALFLLFASIGYGCRRHLEHPTWQLECHQS